MKKFLYVLLFPFMIVAQTTHIVNVGPGMIFSPSELTISSGDVVSWVSQGGTHDVNFDINSLTGESFGNLEEIASASLPVQSGAGEMGSITFNEVGVYDYDCSVESHAAMGMVGSIIVTPSAGFYPPEGSVFNSDSSIVTIPSATQNSDYNESISFYATEEFSIPDVVTLGFVSAEITSVSTPDGMSYSCDPEGCNFGPNAWGYVTLTGTPESAGLYELDLAAMVTVNLASVGLDENLSFPVPYNGENPIINAVFGSDYSALNSFVPTFTINVLNSDGTTSDGTTSDGTTSDGTTPDGTRYVDEIFTNVNVESNVVYGANIGILTQTPVLEDLTMDIYTPEGDDVTNRPVVILLHTGTFLPPIVNGQATGDKSDNTLVELCTRLAKKGYVAVSANYRLGWNPLSTDPDVRTGTLAQAFYRGYQDAQTAVRYLRMSAAEMGNPYGIGDQFAVGGDGTGGYMSLALAALDKDSEILLPKFIDTSDNAIATYGQPVPYIIQSMWGNLEATNYGWHPTMDLDGDGVAQDVPLCVPNHVGYSSEIDMAFNFGGAMLDTLWMEEGEVPIASMQNTNDEFAPYDVGILTEPVNNDPVIEIHGSLPTVRRATALGNNGCFAGLSTTLVDATYGNGDGAANAAAAGHANMPGLFPLVTPAPSAALTACGFQEWDGAPWQWWDNNTYGMMAEAYQGTPAGTMGCLALLSNPDMSEEKGLAFTDMLEEFFTPRIAAALSLDSTINVSGDINGCTDPSAFNYDETVNINDGSCIPFLTGCTNSNYIEYYNQGNTVANVDDGSCFKEVQNLDLVAENFQEPMNTGSNMTVGIDLQSSLYIPEGTLLGAFYDLNQDGIINTDTYIAENGASFSECIGLEEYTEGFFAISLWGDDSSTSTQDGLQSGETDVLFALLTEDNQVIAINVVPEFTGYASNSISILTEFDLDVTIYGCMDQAYCNYNPQAEEDDGSCEGIPGCMEPMYVQYSETAGCSNPDLCLTTWEETYYFALDSAAAAFAADEAADEALLAQTIADADLLLSYTLDSAAAVLAQTIFDYGDVLAYTLDSAAMAFAADEEADEALLAYLSSPIPIDLLLGWNIVGYTFREPQDAVATLQEITDIIEIVKNNAAEVYWPEYGFNGIGNLIPGQGYQIKVTEEYSGFTYLDTQGQRIELTPTVPQWALDMEVEMHPNDIRTLVRVVNILGQEVDPENQPRGSVLLYLYNDATVEKKLVE